MLSPKLILKEYNAVTSWGAAGREGKYPLPPLNFESSYGPEYCRNIDEFSKKSRSSLVDYDQNVENRCNVLPE